MSTSKLDELKEILKRKLLHGKRSKNNKKTDSSLIRDMS
jgi:hypothetical protein